MDPYRAAQARQRRSANQARQVVLQQERQDALGDPVRSQPTPFVESLRPGAPIQSLKESYLNYYLKPDDMQQALDRSKWLTEPVIPTGDPQHDAHKRETFEAEHENATKAMNAIAALDHGSGKDRTRVNILRCIEEFGRHKTDAVLPPKPASTATSGTPALDPSIPIRSGPDTGSSEVQIAVLTTKINVLADNVVKKDKNNKRNLRLLVHKRQKLLKYLRERERGGPRWQNIVDKLGINDAMWKGEITL